MSILWLGIFDTSTTHSVVVGLDVSLIYGARSSYEEIVSHLLVLKFAFGKQYLFKTYHQVLTGNFSTFTIIFYYLKLFAQFRKTLLQCKTLFLGCTFKHL